MGTTVVLCGAGHPAARALSVALEGDDSVDRVVAVTGDELPLVGPKFEVALDSKERLPALLSGADVVVYFPVEQASGPDRLPALVEHATAVRDAASSASVPTFVLWSGGIAYGAHPDNPVPLHESDPLRPNDDFEPARVLAEVEAALSDGEAADNLTVLRAAGVWDPSWHTFLSRTIEASRIVGIRGYDPVVQALHPDDALSALLLATRGGLRGVYNVAPADWIRSSDAARAAGRPRGEVPETVAFSATERLRRARVTNAAPGELHFHMHPWVLASERLVAAGWSPAHTTADALAAAGSARRDGVRLGPVHLRRADVYRGAAAGLAALTTAAVVRRRTRRR